MLQELGRAESSISDLADKFHMTLTDRLEDGIRPAIRQSAESWFAGLGDIVLDRLVIFVEEGPGAAFTRGPEFLIPAEAQ